MTGWHFACVMSDPDGEPPARPRLPEWLNVKAAFDTWLVSTPDMSPTPADEAAAMPPEQLDVMIAYGWKGVDG